MKKIFVVLLAFAMIFALAACNGGGTTPPPAPAEIKVGVVANSADDSVVADFESVFNRANGYDAIFFFGTDNHDQLEAATDFIADGVEYLLVSAVSADGWTEVLEYAQDAGVVVLLFDVELDVDAALFAGVVIISETVEQGRVLQAEALNDMIETLQAGGTIANKVVYIEVPAVDVQEDEEYDEEEDEEEEAADDDEDQAEVDEYEEEAEDGEYE